MKKVYAAKTRDQVEKDYLDPITIDANVSDTTAKITMTAGPWEIRN